MIAQGAEGFSQLARELLLHGKKREGTTPEAAEKLPERGKKCQGTTSVVP